MDEIIIETVLGQGQGASVNVHIMWSQQTSNQTKFHNSLFIKMILNHSIKKNFKRFLWSLLGSVVKNARN